MRVKCERHNSSITHLDFDADGADIQSKCGANELLFYKTIDGEQVAHPSDLKDTVWATQTTVLGWPIKGVWPADEPGAEVTACHVEESKTLVATSDNRGRVKLFRYPCIIKGAEFDVQTGHSSGITNLCFTKESQYVLRASTC